MRPNIHFPSTTVPSSLCEPHLLYLFFLNKFGSSRHLSLQFLPQTKFAHEYKFSKSN